jgi:hypothetical protein
VGDRGIIRARQGRVVVSLVAVALLSGCGVAGATGPSTSPSEASVAANGPASPAYVLPADDAAELSFLPRLEDCPRDLVRAVLHLSEVLGERFPDFSTRFGGEWWTPDCRGYRINAVRELERETSEYVDAWISAQHPGVDVRVVAVEYSSAELFEIGDRASLLVGRAVGEMRATPVTQMTPMPRSNRLHVQVLPGHSAEAQRIRDEFGDVVVVTEDGSRSVPFTS